MTELLRQAIAEIEKLSPDRQDAIAARFLAELQDEEKWETRARDNDRRAMGSNGRDGTTRDRQ